MKMVKKSSLLFIFLIYISFLVVTTEVFLADVYYKDTRNYLRRKNLAKASLSINKAVNKNPHEPRYYKERARVNVALGNKKHAIADLINVKELNPKNLVLLRDSVPLFALTLSEPEIVDALKKVKSIAPNDVGVFVLTARYEKELGLDEMYQESIAQITRLRPDLLEWHKNLIEP